MPHRTRKSGEETWSRGGDTLEGQRCGKHRGIWAVEVLRGHFIGSGEWRETKSDDNRQQRGS